ncbi:mitochondrial import inner membrane translocase subunit Tim54p [[Candida] anglica]|uniref:Mitochondrial import inner membrane translocase subunit TIM54 n=1 Tax=[Candida] anglica TaxID=148631 RepID=A0ABP0EL37_9ASCO
MSSEQPGKDVPSKPVKETVPETKPSKPPKKQWKNPALRAMGIPRFSLPSRNWMIFWTVLAGIGGGIAYDKYEQKKIREKWMLEVSKFAKEQYPNDRIPRKLSIFIAPPPNDFLDESLRYFKRYIKPVLNASAVDFEVYTENRQGDIRSEVAEKIRELRRSKIAKSEDDNEKKGDDKQVDSSNWLAYSHINKSNNNASIDDEGPLVSRQELYTPADVLGLYKVFKPLEVERDDELNPEQAGGVICIGRGAYKEYITGVHEGLLGPLEKPVEVLEETINDQGESVPVEVKVEEDDSDDTDESGAKRAPVPKQYILPKDYANAQFAPELNKNEIIRNNKNVPVLFEQPVYVFPVPNLLGFMNMPRKIYRFYTKRYLADEYGFRTTSVIENLTRPFEYKDSFMGGEEERDWPHGWVEKGKSKNSEWVQELVVDERVTSRMRVFDHELKEKKNDEF